MSWPSAVELHRLAADFQSRALPKTEWTHAAHLAVGAWHVDRYGPAEAQGRLRAGIRLLNDAHGTPNTDTGGYHETITRAYVALIADYLATARSPSLDESVRTFLAGPLAEKTALLAYYSKDLLMSVRARREWVHPDRQPLPMVAGQLL
jgi:hypothetical protein